MISTTEMQDEREAKDATVSYLTDALTGILKEDYKLDESKAESMRAKYSADD